MARGAGMGGPGMSPGLRSYFRDRSVTQHRVAKGTFRRMLRFASPYKALLTAFLVLVGIGASLGALSPLIYRAIINDGILGEDAGLVVRLALLIGGLAVVDAVLSLGERYVSARVGEGLIFDLRSKVFGHVQEMPVAFF